MSERVDSAADGASLPAERAGCETIEAYETDDGVVLYDAQNPLAWVEATETLTLTEQA